MSRQVSRGSAGEDQADEQAGDARLRWRVSGLTAFIKIIQYQWGKYDPKRAKLVHGLGVVVKNSDHYKKVEYYTLTNY